MKAKSLFMCMVLTLPLGFTACSNDTEDVLEPEVQNTVKGTDTRDVDDRPYYWYDGHKEYLSYVENTSFIVFYEKDKESLYNSLSELGIDCSSIEDQEYNTRMHFIEDGPAVNYGEGCRWIKLDVAYQTLENKLPDAISITPLFTNEFNTPFALCNVFYISYGGPMESLEEIIKDYNVEIMGKMEVLNIYFIWCTKDSEGSPLDIANKIYESGKVSWTEPTFHGLGRSAIDI